MKQIGDLPARQCHSGGASLFHRANMVSTPKYHPLPACSRPTEGLAGFFLPSAGSRTGIEGEKDISDTRISDSFRRPCGQVCLKPYFQELLSPPAGGRGKKVRGNLFFSLPALILRELVGQEFHFNKSYESFYKIKPGSHWTSPRIKNAIQIRIIVMSLKK